MVCSNVSVGVQCKGWVRGEILLNHPKQENIWTWFKLFIGQTLKIGEVYELLCCRLKHNI